MTDSRFTTSAEDLEELLAVVDVDDVSDLGTLLTFLFARPIDVEEVVDEDGDAGMESTVWTGDMGFGTRWRYPMTMVRLASVCAGTVEELGPYTADESFPVERQRDVRSMDEAELVAALRDALGKVRIFNMLSADQ